jgi:hypothetical protein
MGVEWPRMHRRCAVETLLARVEAVRGTNHLQKGQIDQELDICPLPEALQSGAGRKRPHPDLAGDLASRARTEKVGS